MVNPFGPGTRVDHSQWTVVFGVSWAKARHQGLREERAMRPPESSRHRHPGGAALLTTTLAPAPRRWASPRGSGARPATTSRAGSR